MLTLDELMNDFSKLSLNQIRDKYKGHKYETEIGVLYRIYFENKICSNK